MRVLHPVQEVEEGQESSPEQPIIQVLDVKENSIGALQELCQKQQISMPRYEFEEMAEWFRCAVQAMVRDVEEGGESGSCCWIVEGVGEYQEGK